MFVDKDFIMDDGKDASDSPSTDLLVGQRLKDLRTRSGYSLRVLAERSALNINTLSLIENGKSSPSVSTLQQLALALDVPITAFFASEPRQKSVVFTPAGARPEQSFGSTRMQNLGKDLAGNAIQPFIVTIHPGMGSGENRIVHTGFEFVFCLNGSLNYWVEQEEFSLQPGDSLLFEAHLAHSWQNDAETPCEILLLLVPSDTLEKPGCKHFSLQVLKKEINMKIAAITDDGKTISRHFGRAPYYLVLTIEEGKITAREMHDKIGHTHFQNTAHAEEAHGQGHGMDAASHDKHISMAEAIADCKALLCGGMGMGAYESMRRLNIQPVVTDLTDIEEAALAFVDGKLVDHTELLH